MTNNDSKNLSKKSYQDEIVDWIFAGLVIAITIGIFIFELYREKHLGNAVFFLFLGGISDLVVGSVPAILVAGIVYSLLRFGFDFKKEVALKRAFECGVLFWVVLLYFSVVEIESGINFG